MLSNNFSVAGRAAPQNTAIKMREYILVSVTCILTQITAESFMAFGNEKQRIKVPCGPHVSDTLLHYRHITKYIHQNVNSLVYFEMKL